LKNLRRVSKIARVHLTQCCNLCYGFIRVVSSLKIGEAYDDRRNPVSHIERWGFIFSQMPIITTAAKVHILVIYLHNS